MNAAMRTPAPDDEQSRADRLLAAPRPRPENLLGWPLGAVLVVALIALVAAVVTGSAVAAVVMTAIGGAGVVVIDLITD